MSYIYTMPTADGDANKLFGHRSFGVFGQEETGNNADGNRN